MFFFILKYFNLFLLLPFFFFYLIISVLKLFLSIDYLSPINPILSFKLYNFDSVVNNLNYFNKLIYIQDYFDFIFNNFFYFFFMLLKIIIIILSLSYLVYFFYLLQFLVYYLFHI